MNLSLTPHGVRANTDREIDAAFETITQQRIPALLVAGSPFFDTRRDKLVALTARNAVPTIHCASHAARPRRRGDRVVPSCLRKLLHLLRSPNGATRTIFDVRGAAALRGKADVRLAGASSPVYEYTPYIRTTRGSLPDHPIRPSIKTAEGDEKLLGLLSVGVLVIRASDFDVWYRSERAKGKWPSQRSKLKIGGGRPTKQAERVRNAVIRLVRDDKWSGKASIAKLHRLLIGFGDIEVPSPDTLARLVDQLHAETGEAEFLRAKRPRRKRAQTALPQNPISGSGTE